MRALLGRTNRDWWPDALAVDLLAPYGPADPMGAVPGDRPVYPDLNVIDPVYNARRKRVGEMMYDKVGIPKEDRAGRLMWFANNYRFFGAPVGLFLIIDKRMGHGQWAHMGMYMQTIALLAEERGWGTCMQECWARLRVELHEHFGLDENHMVYAGIALGVGLALGTGRFRAMLAGAVVLWCVAAHVAALRPWIEAGARSRDAIAALDADLAGGDARTLALVSVPETHGHIWLWAWSCPHAVGAPFLRHPVPAERVIERPINYYNGDQWAKDRQPAAMVRAGFTGVWDVLDDGHNLISALASNPHPEQMVADLGSKFYVSESAIKVFSVGYPIQAPLDAFLTLRRQHGLTPANVKSIVVRLPADGANIVNNSAMPDVNVQIGRAHV